QCAWQMPLFVAAPAGRRVLQGKTAIKQTTGRSCRQLLEFVHGNEGLHETPEPAPGRMTCEDQGTAPVLQPDRRLWYRNLPTLPAMATVPGRLCYHVRPVHQ